MHFRWDWIEPVMPVPYVPTLGPVYPDSPLPDLFHAALEAAGTGGFLPYDKDRRWSSRKEERVLVDAVEHGPDRVLIPTLVERGAGMVKVHMYGAAPGSLSAGADLARKLAVTHGAGKARIVVPRCRPAGGVRPRRDPRPAQGVHPAGSGTGRAGPGVRAPARGCRVRRVRGDDGRGRLPVPVRAPAGRDGRPVLTVLHDGRVAGAIGPMETMPDHGGRARLLPQYFGVLPEHRGHGYGRALWRAAMRWGHEHGAAYQLLQTEVGGASDRLCIAEGLSSLGFVNQADV
ncbi:GNAT family N-acetyltransferase [Streptomyces sp. INA 01156]